MHKHTHIYIHMEIKLPKLGIMLDRTRLLEHKTLNALVCNCACNLWGHSIYGDTALLAVYPKLLSADIAKLIWTFRGTKMSSVIHSKENILFTYIMPLLHWESRLHFTTLFQRANCEGGYRVLQKAEAKICHLKLTKAPVVKWKMFMLHCFRTQPPSCHGACKEGYSLEGLNGCKSSVTKTKIFIQIVLSYKFDTVATLFMNPVV